MEKKRNYQSEMESILHSFDIPESGRRNLLLHACCAPCSSHVLSVLTHYFNIAILYYNPNIAPREEYLKRLAELQRLIKEMPFEGSVELLDAPYDPETYYQHVCGLENEPEGGTRCTKCFDQRLDLSARSALANSADYFATTLTVSPYKNAPLINSIGETLSETYPVKYLCTDFKKKEGYKHSIQLSNEYQLYRQHYCGCTFSIPKIESA